MNKLDIKSSKDTKDKKIDTIEVNANELIKLYLSEETEATHGKIYQWKGTVEIDNINTIYRGERKVLVQLSNIYCGYPINIELELVDKFIIEKNLLEAVEAVSWMMNGTDPSKRYDTQKQDSESDTVQAKAKRTFIAECQPNIKQIKWLNDLYQELPKEYIIPFTEAFGYIFLEIEGLNRKEIQYEIWYNQIKGEVSTTSVQKNKVHIRYKVPKKAYNPDKKSEVEIKLRIKNFNSYIAKDPRLQPFIDRSINSHILVFTKKIYIDGESTYENRIAKMPDGVPLEPVVIGAIAIAENNYMPCKFIEVIISEEEVSKNIFSEAGSDFESFTRKIFGLTWRTLEDHAFTQKKVYNELSFRKTHPFAMIAGADSKTVNITVKDFETDKCVNNPKHTNNSIKVDDKEVSLLLRGDNQKIDGEVQLNFSYNYSSGSALFVPWDCFFPFNKPQEHVVEILSCRHTLNLPVNVYPDIQWAFTLKFDIVEGKKAESFSGLFSDEIRPGVYDITPRKTKREVMKNSLEMGFGVSWDNKKYYSGIIINYNDTKNTIKEDGLKGILTNYLQNELYIKFKLLYDMVMDVVGFLQMFETVLAIVQTVEDVTGQNLPVPGARKKPQFELLLPSVDLSLAWRAGVHEGRSGFVIEGKGDGTIIGCTATFDMFALAGKMPQLRAIVWGLEILQWMGIAEFKFDLIITGEVKLEGMVAYDQSQDKFDAELGINTGLQMMLVLEGRVEAIENNRLVTKVYGTDAVAGLELLYKLQVEDGLWGQAQFNFTGLEGSIYTDIIVKDTGRGSADSDSSGPQRPTHEEQKKTFIQGFPIWESDRSRFI